MSYFEKTFEAFAEDAGMKFEKEFQFHPTRKWRFDYADEKNKIAVELEGGVWVYGRHNRGKGFINDTIKYNAATVLGWRVLRYCSIDDIAERFIDDYTKLLSQKNGKRTW